MRSPGSTELGLSRGHLITGCGSVPEVPGPRQKPLPLTGTRVPGLFCDELPDGGAHLDVGALPWGWFEVVAWCGWVPGAWFAADGSQAGGAGF